MTGVPLWRLAEQPSLMPHPHVCCNHDEDQDDDDAHGGYTN